jgi:hypothetical protein
MLCVVFVTSQGDSILLSIFHTVGDPCLLIMNSMFVLLLVIFVTPVKHFAFFLHDLRVSEEVKVQSENGGRGLQPVAEFEI